MISKSMYGILSVGRRPCTSHDHRSSSHYQVGVPKIQTFATRQRQAKISSTRDECTSLRFLYRSLGYAESRSRAPKTLISYSCSHVEGRVTRTLLMLSCSKVCFATTNFEPPLQRTFAETWGFGVNGEAFRGTQFPQGLLAPLLFAAN